jgi:para-nitrobenzyl esterase
VFGRSIVLALLVLVTGCSTATAPESAPPTSAPPDLVRTDAGELRGVVDGDVVRFKGVPYAAPPVGDLRWAPPQPVAPWEGTRDASRSGPFCAQTAVDASGGSTAEDCLTLDVTAPGTPGEKRPVMVWLHGGGFTAGGIDVDPRRMAARGDAVVVTVNFRLGIFGYLGLPGMTDAGTLGLADQQEALRFVQRNAAAFGGDPDNVTLFGESGGGIATCLQLASPGSEGLVDRAILQSFGPCAATPPPNALAPGTPELPFHRPLAEVEQASVEAAARLGCPDPTTALACLRALPVETVLREHQTFSAAAVGTPLLPEAPPAGLSHTQVPVLAGGNRDESRAIAAVFALLQQPITDDTYPALLQAGFGDRAAAVEQEYPRADYPSAAAAWSAIYTDRTWTCPQREATDALAGPVFTYEFADPTAPPYIPVLPGSVEPGAAHASELAYLFDLDGKPIDIQGNPLPLTPEQRALGDTMIDTWTGFARTGTLPTSQTLVFGDSTTVDHHCDFWAG